MHGLGSFIPSTNNPTGIFYDGEWKNGKSNGQGITIWKHGDVFKGNSLAN